MRKGVEKTRYVVIKPVSQRWMRLQRGLDLVTRKLAMKEARPCFGGIDAKVRARTEHRVTKAP